jgi:hypothetical protein
MVFLLKFNKVIHTLNVLGEFFFQLWLKHNGSGRTTNEFMAKENNALILETIEVGDDWSLISCLVFFNTWFSCLPTLQEIMIF